MLLINQSPVVFLSTDIPGIAEYITPATKTNTRFSRKISLTLRRRLLEIEKKSARQRVTKLLRSLEHV